MILSTAILSILTTQWILKTLVILSTGDSTDFVNLSCCFLCLFAPLFFFPRSLDCLVHFDSVDLTTLSILRTLVTLSTHDAADFVHFSFFFCFSLSLFLSRSFDDLIHSDSGFDVAMDFENSGDFVD